MCACCRFGRTDSYGLSLQACRAGLTLHTTSLSLTTLYQARTTRQPQGLHKYLLVSALVFAFVLLGALTVSSERPQLVDLRLPCCRPLVQIPFGLGAVTAFYNIPGTPLPTTCVPGAEKLTWLLSEPLYTGVC